MMQICNLAYSGAGIHFQNVKIAETICLFRLQSTVNTVTGEHGSSDNEMILQVGQRIFGEDTGSLQMKKRVFLAVFVYSFHITGSYGIVKRIFHRGRAMKSFRFCIFQLISNPVLGNGHIDILLIC